MVYEEQPGLAEKYPDLPEKYRLALVRQEGQSDDEFKASLKAAIREAATELLPIEPVGHEIIRQLIFFAEKCGVEFIFINTLVCDIVVALLEEQAATPSQPELRLIETVSNDMVSIAHPMLEALLQELSDRQDIDEETKQDIRETFWRKIVADFN